MKLAAATAAVLVEKEEAEKEEGEEKCGVLDCCAHVK